jgi:hypothetical protein
MSLKMKLVQTFNQLPDELIFIISSFLLPRDILRFRILSKYYSNVISTFLKNKKNRVNIYELVCPLCGNDWISQENNLDDYYDIDVYTHFGEFHERNNYIQTTYPSKETSREHLLCDECENKIIENPNIYDFKLFKNELDFHSDFYQLHVDYFSPYPWVCLVKNTPKKVVWNQFNCIIEEDERLSISDSELDDFVNNYNYEYSYESE